MNAVNEHGEIVGGDSVIEQATQVRKNLEAALRAAGCDWTNVVRVTVQFRAGVDPHQAFSVFAPALSERAAPPLVGGYHVEALARPEFLLEVSLEAVK
jgi:enamine deaminase RidA (YjgF/YER057c/UK114 family)